MPSVTCFRDVASGLRNIKDLCPNHIWVPGGFPRPLRGRTGLRERSSRTIAGDQIAHQGGSSRHYRIDSEFAR